LGLQSFEAKTKKGKTNDKKLSHFISVLFTTFFLSPLVFTFGPNSDLHISPEGIFQGKKKIGLGDFSSTK
jgi:hypothetical protein